MQKVTNNILPDGVWIVLAVFFSAFAAICFKKTAIIGSEGSFIEVLLTPWYGTAILSLFLQSVCWIMALRRFALGVAYPFLSLVVVLNMVSAVLIFGETVHPMHIAGAILIMSGVILIGITQSKN